MAVPRSRKCRENEIVSPTQSLTNEPQIPQARLVARGWLVRSAEQLEGQYAHCRRCDGDDLPDYVEVQRGQGEVGAHAGEDGVVSQQKVRLFGASFMSGNIASGIWTNVMAAGRHIWQSWTQNGTRPRGRTHRGGTG